MHNGAIIRNLVSEFRIFRLMCMCDDGENLAFVFYLKVYPVVMLFGLIGN